jgi:outer membrane receptor protein involved in Fe transport
MKLAGLPTSVKGFYTLDFITRYSISKNLNAFINVNNVFNAYYGGIDAYNDITNLVYNPQYGRTFRIGFTFRLE